MKGGIDAADLIRRWPWAYHVTFAANLASIVEWRRLDSASRLMRGAGCVGERKRRLADRCLPLGEHQVTLRNQSALDPHGAGAAGKRVFGRIPHLLEPARLLLAGHVARPGGRRSAHARQAPRAGGIDPSSDPIAGRAQRAHADFGLELQYGRLLVGPRPQDLADSGACAVPAAVPWRPRRGRRVVVRGLRAVAADE